MRRVGIGLVTATIVTMCNFASAQPVRPLIPVASSDTLTLPDARDVSALTPLRLGLMSGAVPHAFGTPGCEPVGLATGLSPLPNLTVAANGLRLPRAVRLTLFGFSRDGCAYDRVGGAGFVMTIPIKKDVMFMWGGGAIYLPHGGPGGAPTQEVSATAGIVWTTKSGRSYNVGISAKNGTPHVSFGGMF